MSKEKPYRSIDEIVKELSSRWEALESGKLDLSELNDLTEASRELYERLVVIRHKAMEDGLSQTSSTKKEKKKEETKKAKKEVVEEKEEAPETEKGFSLDLTGNKDAKPSSSEPAKEKSKKNKIKKDKKKGKKIKGRQESIPIPDQPLPFNNPNPPQKVDVPSKEEEEAIRQEISAGPGQTNLLDVIEGSQNEETVNQKLGKDSKVQSLADKLSKSPIDDLPKAIAIGQKFLFMNELFDGENEHYKEAVEKLNNFDDLHSANEYIKEELVDRFDWDVESKTAMNFMELVARRYL